MAATAEFTRRIERQLDALLAEVRDLPALAEDWNDLNEGARVSQSLDWDHLMADYLAELDDHWHLGAMNAMQAQRFHELLLEIERALPIIDRLHFSRPLAPRGR
jgi:hypothetical protein